MTTKRWLHIVVFIFNQNIFSDILIANQIGIYKRGVSFVAQYITPRETDIYTSLFLLLKHPFLTEVQRYVFDSLLKYQLTRDSDFALIRSCGNEVYKVEKLNEDT